MEGQVGKVFAKLSLEVRLNHKYWEARVSGYEELARKFPLFEDKEFNKYSPLIKEFVLDTKPAAQEKGLAAVLPYVQYCPNEVKYNIKPIVVCLVTECLNSTRSKTRELAHDILLMCVEVGKQVVVLEELIKGLEQKIPENVAACVRMITKCLNQFGSKVIAIKRIVPSLSNLLEDRDATVRADTKLLAIEIYRWVKDALLPKLSDLKPILLDSLKGEFENVKAVKPSPERLLRSPKQRALVDVNSGAGGTARDGPDESAPAPEEEEVDPFELMEAVDIVSKLPSDFYTLIEAIKWQQRKESLDKLQQLLEAHPKLVTTSDYGELIEQLKRIIGKDTNIVVATLAIKCLSMLVSGLRKGFDEHANSCVSVVLEKFKEKKANVVQSLREAIDAIYLQTSLEAIQVDLTTSLADKNPSIRSETALFLARSFAKTNPNLVNKKLLKTLVTSLLTTLGDSDPTVRESSAQALGTAAKAQGDRNMLPLLQQFGLEQLKMAKIDEYKAKVEVKKFPAEPPTPAPAAAPPKAKPAPSKRTGGATPAPASNYSSQESLNDPLPEAPAPKPKPAASKFGTTKSKLDTVSLISTANDGSATTSASTSAKYGTVKRPRTVASKRAKPGGTPSAGSSRKADDPSVASAMMLPNVKAKKQRFSDEKALKVLKWNFDSPREEFYIQLKEQMQAADWNAALVTNLFHSDFKNHLKGIDVIRDFFSSKDSNATECVVANLDLILKWIALRFFDTNTSVIMKALELLLIIFKILEASGYSMIDVEANSFFPYLLLKVGDPKEVVRNKVHEILIILRNLYPANKIFSHLLAGLQSKNSRQRATCLEELALLIQLKGMAIFQPPNSIQEVKDIAQFLSERDTGVRNGALNCILQVYFIEGRHKVFKMVGNLSANEMSLIEERMKRQQQPQTAEPAPPAPAAAPSKSKPAPPKRTDGARVVTRAPAPNCSSQESLNDPLPEAPAPKPKPAASKFGTMISRLDTRSVRSTASDGSATTNASSAILGGGSSKRKLPDGSFESKGKRLKPEAEEPMDTNVEFILTATTSISSFLDDAQQAINRAQEQLTNLQSRLVENPVNLPSSG